MKKIFFFVLTLLLFAVFCVVVKNCLHKSSFPPYLSVTCENRMKIFIISIYDYKDKNGHFPVLNDGKWKRECFPPQDNLPGVNLCLCPIFAYANSASVRIVPEEELLTNFVGLQLPITCRDNDIFVVVHSIEAVPLSANDMDYREWCIAIANDTRYSHKEVMVLTNEISMQLPNDSLKSVINASNNSDDFKKKIKRFKIGR